MTYLTRCIPMVLFLTFAAAAIMLGWGKWWAISSFVLAVCFTPMHSGKSKTDEQG